MQKINLRELYPDIYKKDTYLEVTDEVQAVFLADKRAEARYLRRVFPTYGVRFIAITDNIDTAHEGSGDDLTVSVVPFRKNFNFF